MLVAARAGGTADRGGDRIRGRFEAAAAAGRRQLVVGNVVVVVVQPPGRLLRVLTPDLEFELA